MDTRILDRVLEQYNQRITQYREKAGDGINDERQYYTTVGRIKELKELTSSLEELRKELRAS